MPSNDSQPDYPELRRITDAQTMRALSHPVRLALVEALGLGTEMTATEVGERIGESPTTCSFHLRQLQKYGFVEEAGGGRGRSRPWRMTQVGFSFAAAENDPESELASSALLRVIRDRQLDRYRTWVETKGTYPRAWQQAANETELMFYCTPDELEQLNDELHALLLPKFRDRRTDPSKRPPGAVAVEMQVLSYPIELPQPDSAD